MQFAANGYRIRIQNNEAENGNFLSNVNLISNYDPVLENLSKNPKNAFKYLSPSIQNELNMLLSKHAENIIFDEINEASFCLLLLTLLEIFLK